jgi:predicted tellurium resistance membrane protein TerC
MYCPKCQARLYFSFPYSALAAVLSLLLAIAALWVIRVTSLVWFTVGTLVLWVPFSMFVKIYFTRFKPATLEKWKPRRRTFFEWLYDRDKPPEMFDR